MIWGRHSLAIFFPPLVRKSLHQRAFFFLRSEAFSPGYFARGGFFQHTLPLNGVGEVSILLKNRRRLQFPVTNLDENLFFLCLVQGNSDGLCGFRRPTSLFRAGALSLAHPNISARKSACHRIPSAKRLEIGKGSKAPLILFLRLPRARVDIIGFMDENSGDDSGDPLESF